jgi:hypothetical protein
MGVLVFDEPGEDIPRQSLYFCTLWIFFEVGKKIVLVRGKECRRNGSKRDEKGQKLLFSILFHHT